jgi:hypothetical protein
MSNDTNAVGVADPPANPWASPRNFPMRSGTSIGGSTFMVSSTVPAKR